MLSVRARYRSYLAFRLSVSGYLNFQVDCRASTLGLAAHRNRCSNQYSHKDETPSERYSLSMTDEGDCVGAVE
jgi:hypothetical protein